MEYSSKNSHDVLQLQDLVNFSEDLQRDQGEEREEERRESLLYVLGDQHGDQEGHEEFQREEGGREETYHD